MNISVLEIYEKNLLYLEIITNMEVIQGADRKMVEKIPEAAFIANRNALIHRYGILITHQSFYV